MSISDEEIRSTRAKVEEAVGFTFREELIDLMIRDYSSPEDMPEDFEGRLIEFAYLHKLQLGGISLPKQRKQSKPKQRPRPPDKRLHLIGFVIERTKAVGLNPRNKPQKWYIIDRIKWGNISKAWNEAHKFDPVTPKSLKSRFNAAIVDPDVQREIIVIQAAKVFKKRGFIPTPERRRPMPSSGLTQEQLEKRELSDDKLPVQIFFPGEEKKLKTHLENLKKKGGKVDENYNIR
jgi:hypothetical protein